MRPSYRPNTQASRDPEGFQDRSDGNITTPATDDAKKWAGWGTALKPAHEPIVLARKPLAEDTVAANVLAHGTGALNVDACRVPTDEDCARKPSPNANSVTYAQDEYTKNMLRGGRGSDGGRFPANIIHDGSPEVLAGFGSFGNSGSAARFFTACPFDPDIDLPFHYCPKASKSDRGPGNTHPTVKPVALIRHLVKLVTPPGGTVLDPFLGSGTTAVACQKEGFGCVGIEMTPEYLAIAETRTGVKMADAPPAAA